MSVLGGTDIAPLISRLDPKLLVRLVRDILVKRGHGEVRETDGPGDSTRDIYSRTPLEKRHLSQCKYHEDSSKSCSSREVSELPLGMLKHGYQNGLFVTNARLSAAAKRELLDNYPSMCLEFLDGQELLAEVMAHSVLRALWYDGKQLSNIPSKVTFPIIVRIHDGDRPLSPTEYRSSAQKLLKAALKRATTDMKHLSFESGSSLHWTMDSFSPYRLPEARCIEEGGMSKLHVLLASAMGKLTLSDITLISTRVASELAESASRAVGPVTVVVGQPALEPVVGPGDIRRMLLAANPVRIVGQAGKSETEEGWFAPAHERWTTECDARVTEMPLVRIYHRGMDICTTFEVRSPLTPFQKMNRQRHRRSWDRCLYALVPPDFSDRFTGVVPAPDILLEWQNKEIQTLGMNACRIGVWWHKHYVADGDCIEPDAYDRNQRSLRSRVENETARLDLIRRKLEKLSSCNVISARTARLLYSLSGRDPSGFEEYSCWDTAELLTNFELLPSPVDPRSRRFGISVAWKIKKGVAAFEKVVQVTTAGQAARIEKDGGYVVLNLYVSGLNLAEPTRKVLDDVEAAAQATLAAIETATHSKFVRATRAYWREKYGVRLGAEYGEKD